MRASGGIADTLLPAAGGPAWQGLLRALWTAPFPALLQDARFRIVDTNPAFAAICARPRTMLIGIDPLELQPPDDHDAVRAERADLTAGAARGDAPPLLRRRLRVGGGTDRWYMVTTHNLAAAGAPALWLSVLQDVTAEYAARDQARRLQDELAQWFELAATGMLVYDDTGLILRSNTVFEAMVGRVPEVMTDAAPELQALLGWQGGALDATFVAGAPPAERQAIVPLADGRRRRLAARLACSAGDGGTRRVMAVIEDLSAEDERDLAQLEIGMLMDTASVGVATFDPTRGWLAPSHGAVAAAGGGGGAGGSGAGGASGALLSIGRDVVEPESLPEFERLQKALRQGERTEARYAVRHREIGVRWLLTRVEPGALAGGRATTSVVTIDVTDQERAQRRNEALLRELTGILDTSNAGIASLRWPLLVRCNRRFERMLGFAPGAAAGATLGEIFARQGASGDTAAAVLEALQQGRAFETELPLAPDAGGAPRWASLSVRRAEAADAAAHPAHGEPAAPAAHSGRRDAEAIEAVAVLTDVTRLKAQQAELEQLVRDRELMFNLSEVGIAYLRGARIERANQAMGQLSGYAVPELTALDPSELYVDARDCVEFEARMAEALREAGRFVGERRLRRRDGSLCWVQVSARPVAPEEPHADGDAAAAEAGGVICSFVDVDERHRARDALAQQAERTRAMLNSVLVGIVTVGEGGIEWMNRSARRMFAGELADFVGEPMATVATPEPEHPLRRLDWLERLQDGQSEAFECRLRGRDGREFWVVGNAVAAGGENGTRQLTFALLDIERRRQAELRIGQAQASLQRVIEMAPLAIALFDAGSLRVAQVNQAAAGFLGRAAEQATGATPAELFDEERAALLTRWLEAAAYAGEPAQHEWQDGVSASGPRVWDVRIAPLAAAVGGAPEQLLLVASDVTEQRVAEQARLQAAIAQREVLVREVHHRIKNNLQGVAGLLRQNAERHPEVAATLTEAVGQVQAIAQVYGLQVGAQGPLGVAALLDAIAQSVQRTFGREIRVEAAGVPHLLPEAESIPVALTLNELLTNAIKHGEGGEVRCRVAASGDTVSVRIASRARLDSGFDLAKVRGGVSGLGLVRALLPRRSATLAIRQDGDDVVAEVTLRPPGVRLGDNAT